MQQPARDFEDAWSSMSYVREAGLFALAGFPEPPHPADWELLAPPAQLIRERDETSILLAKERLPELLQRHPKAQVEDDLVWIRFEVAMGWEVVGFLARVTGALAAAGVPIGAVCGFSRDHLFIAEARIESAEAVLADLFSPEGRRGGGSN